MTTLLSVVLNMFTSILNIFLKPIDLLLSTIVPNYNDIIGFVITLLSYFRNTFLFFLNWIHIPSGAITLIIGYITFKITLFFGTLSYKLFIKWYHYIKN